MEKAIETLRKQLPKRERRLVEGTAELRAEKEEQAYQQWLQDLRGRATIEVDWSRL